MFPNTFREFLPLLNSGVAIELQCRKKIEDLESYPNEHIRLTTVSASINQDDVVHLEVDYSKYEDYNSTVEQRNYYDKDHVPRLTAREAGFYRVQDTLYLMADDNPNDYFEGVAVESQQLIKRFLAEKEDGETYGQWLERKLWEAEASDSESLSMYRNRRKRFEEIEAELEEAQSERMEQARLLGMSSEQEYSLRGELERQERDIARLKDALQRIAAIENELVGPDWEEIDRARAIARDALATSYWTRKAS
jgi:hypothetical protein